MTTQLKSCGLHPVADVVEGVLDGDAESLLDQGAPQLARHRLLALADDGVDRLGEGESGREAARHQRQRLGELGVEGGLALGVLALEPPPRQGQADEEER